MGFADRQTPLNGKNALIEFLWVLKDIGFLNVERNGVIFLVTFDV
jgi:hypothetical protein